MGENFLEVCIWLVKKGQKILYEEYKVGDKWSVDKLLSIGYEVVEKLYGMREISILGKYFNFCIVLSIYLDLLFGSIITSKLKFLIHK